MSFLSVFDMKNVTLYMRTWREVRNFANQEFLISHHVPMHRVIFYIPNTLIKLIIRA